MQQILTCDMQEPIKADKQWINKNCWTFRLIFPTYILIGIYFFSKNSIA